MPSSLSVSGTLILVFSAHKPAKCHSVLGLFCLAFLASYPLVSIFNSCLEGKQAVCYISVYPSPLKRILTPQVLSDAFQVPLDLAETLLIFLPLSNSCFPRFAASFPHLGGKCRKKHSFPFSWDFVPRNTDCLKSSPMPVNMFFNLAFSKSLNLWWEPWSAVSTQSYLEAKAQGM